VCSHKFITSAIQVASYPPIFFERESRARRRAYCRNVTVSRAAYGGRLHILPGTSLEPPRLQVPNCRMPTPTYSMRSCFCSKPIAHSPGIASKFFFKPSVTVPVAQIITGISII